MTTQIQTHTKSLTLLPDHAQRLANLCGHLNEHIQQIEQSLALRIQQRSNVFKLTGEEEVVDGACHILEELYLTTINASTITPAQVHLHLSELLNELSSVPTQINSSANKALIVRTPRSSVQARGDNQKLYIESIRSHDINFGIGPAGTGKTYLAVACAVEALTQDKVSRILLVRPAVEAGEKLGFLPGDLAQKIDPYLRPLYDALYEMLGFERVGKLIEKNIIEVAPLAYMRGRTLNNAFIILDESQNTTTTQMKMFLTRIGFGSTAVITGDVTQIDLPKGTRSGLVQVTKVLEDIQGISFNHFTSKDVVRHRLVQKIVEAYSDYDARSISNLNNQEPSHINERDS